MKFKFKVYAKENTQQATLEIVKNQCKLINLGKISLDAKYGYSYTAYIHGKESKIDNKYKEELHLDLDLQQTESLELFIKDISEKVTRIVAIPQDKNIALENCNLYYKHIKRDSHQLCIYFDYSRAVEKTQLTEEFIPSFNFKTKKDILIIGNLLGFWGTATLFSNNGKSIHEETAKFINETIDSGQYKDVFIVGGSQGATAALAYGAAIPQCREIHAACPVDISKSSMLKHLKDKITDQDIIEAKNLVLKTLLTKKCFLYSTKFDFPHFDHHEYLAKFIPKENYLVCEDPQIGHGDCLRYYIKRIYSSIDSL